MLPMLLPKVPYILAKNIKNLIPSAKFHGACWSSGSQLGLHNSARCHLRYRSGTHLVSRDITKCFYQLSGKIQIT